MSFSGYLIKFLGSNGRSAVLPLKYMRSESYLCTPNQRLDLDPTRDVTGLLHRNALRHTATKVEFDVPRMSSIEINQMMTLIRSYWIDTKARDVNMEYYDMETDSYKTGHFYMPDIKFTIRNIDVPNQIVNYEETRLAFIEY